MSPSVGYATLQIIPSARGFKKYLEDEVGGPLDSVTKRVKDDSRGIGGAFKAVGGRIVGAFTKATKVAGAFGAVTAGLAIKGGFSRAMNIEDAQAALRGLGHDTTSIERIMESALASVRGTAFGLGDAAQIASTAVAAGIEPGDKLTRTLKLTSNAAALARTSLGDMGSILNKVWTSGRVGTEELNQLADRGIPIWTKLAEHYKVSATELRKMVSQGKVDAATFADVLENTVGDAAFEMGKTTRGAWQNMMAALGRAGEAFLKGVWPMFQTGLTGLIGLLDNVAPYATRAGEVLAEGVRRGVAIASDMLARLRAWWDTNGPAMIAKAEEVFGAIRSWVDDVATAIRSWVEDVLGNLARWWDDHGPKIVAVAETIGVTLFRIGERAMRAVQAIVRNWSKIYPVLRKVAGFIAAVLIPHWTRLGVAATVSAAKQAAAWIATQAKAAASAAAQVAASYRVIAGWVAGAAAATFNAAKVVASWVLMGVQSMIHAARMAAAWFIALGPVGWAIAAVAGIAALVVTNWDTVKRVTAAVWSFVSDHIGTVVRVILGIFTGGLSELVLLVIRNWDQIRDTVMRAVDAVVGFVTAIPRRIGGVASTAFDAIKTGITSAKDWVSGRIEEIVGFVTGLPGRISGIVSGMWEVLKGSLESVVRWITEKIDKLLSPLRRVRDMIGGLTKSNISLPPEVLAQLEGRWMGGAVAAGNAYVVGERGPELFVPRQSGTIVPNHALTATGGAQQSIGTVNIYSTEPARALYDETLWRLTG